MDVEAWDMMIDPIEDWTAITAESQTIAEQSIILGLIGLGYQPSSLGIHSCPKSALREGSILMHKHKLS